MTRGTSLTAAAAALMAASLAEPPSVFAVPVFREPQTIRKRPVEGEGRTEAAQDGEEMTEEMTSVADKYISKSGRTASYDRSAHTYDLIDAASFLCWAEEDGALYAGVEAKTALRAMCRMLDIDPRGLRKAIMGASR